MVERPLDVTAVYREHGDFVWRTLQRMGVPAADLDDVLQEVFVVVHRRLASYDGRSKPTTWLYGICLRIASRHRRRAYFRREVRHEDTREDADLATPERALEQVEAARRLERLLATLAPEKRAVLVMFEIEEKSCQEIAEVSGVPIGTVHSRLHAARADLERAVARERKRAR
jgi:RNA polymerase sigma-70 factor (ECF subfamily)